MKRLLPLVFVILYSLFFSQDVKASHCAGGEITYEWVSDSTYKFTLRFYRDCSGTTVGTTFPLCYNNSCNSSNGSGSITLNQVGSPTEVSLGCPGAATTCSTLTSTIPGYQEYVYQGNFTLPYRCDHWTFFTFLSARNSSNNLYPDQSIFYIETTLDNLHAQGQSSPFFSVKPIPYVCVNKPYTFNNGAIDPNNDSLVFEMTKPYTNSGSCFYNVAQPLLDTANVRGNGTFNLTNNPFPTGNSFSLNSVYGQLSFTPTTIGASTTTVLVKKYRNGILLGTIMRDIQIQVIPCNSVQPTVNIISSTISGATLDAQGQILACSGQPLAFCFDAKSADTGINGAKLIITDNHGVAAPGSAMSITHSYSDSLRGCFSWTPGFLDTGLKNLTISIKDSSCRPPGIQFSQTFVLPVYISPVTQILKDTTICPADSAKLEAVGGSNFVWSVLPGGSPLSTLSCTNCKSPIATPTVTTQYVVTANNLSYCNKNKDTVTITVTNATITPTVSISASQSNICLGNSVTYTATATYGGSAPVYQWKVNGNNVGTNSNTYNYIPVYGDVISCVLTSNISCAITHTANSNNITMSANSTVAPSISIYASQNNVCAGSSVTYTATPTNGGITPAYQWMVNGINAGTNSNTYNYKPADGDIVSCVLTSSAACVSPATATSNYITMSMTPMVTPTVSINASQNNVCPGVSVIDTAMPTDGGTAPAYQWMVNGINTGTNSDTYSYMPAYGDVISCVLTSNAACVTTTTTSNNITMSANSTVTPSISIYASQNNVCPGSSVTYTATPTNGGIAPAYQWKINGINAGTSSNTFNYTPVNGDVVSCVLTSSAAGVSPATATSNNVTMSVNSTGTPGVSIVANPGTNIGFGKQITFIANTINGGANPKYQWRKNGVDIPGATQSTYTTTAGSGIQHADKIYVVVTNTDICGKAASSNVLTIYISTGINNVAGNTNSLNLYPNPNDGSFMVKGTLSNKEAHTIVLKVYNTIGQSIYKEEVAVANGLLEHKIELSKALPTGSYFLKLNDGSDVIRFTIAGK